MRKSRWRESITSLGSHIDPEKDEQVKKTKIELDDRVTKLMKLIQHKSQSKNGGSPIFYLELIELIDEFHKKYQSLYALYENLKGEILEKVHGKDNQDTSSASFSSSLSTGLETYNSVRQFEILPRVIDEYEHQLIELRNNLYSLSEENETLRSDYIASLRRLEESEKVIKELGECLVETEREFCTQKKELEEENGRWREFILEVEMTSKKKEEKLCDLLRKLEENEGDLMSKNEDLMEKANDLELELNALWAQEGRVWQEELHLLSPHKSRSEPSLLRVHDEALDFLIRVESLKEKFERKKMDLQRIFEEKEGLKGKVKKLENQIKIKILEDGQLREENEGLHVRISQLEESLLERNDEIFELQTEFEGLKNDSSNRIKVLGEEIMDLHEDLDLLEREKQELSDTLDKMDDENIELRSKIQEYQRTMKDQEEIINKLNEVNKQVIAAERKITEATEEFSNKFEENLSILSRKILVIEQLHEENKDFFRKRKDLKVKDISAVSNEILSGLNAVEMKFQERNGRFFDRISMVSCEVTFAKNWVKRKNEVTHEMEGNVDFLFGEVGRKEAEIMGLREKIWKLEHEVREMGKMMREKEEGILGLGEEKREAIRQLCVWVDYHRSQSINLKKILYTLSVFRSPRTN